MRYYEKAIDRLRKANALALRMNDNGFYLAFSGGKDSQCIYHLAKMAGVKFTAHMHLTSVDPPEVIRFVYNQYPDVELIRPQMSIFRLAEQMKFLPTGKARYCCRVYKEIGGVGRVTITGVRRAESVRRSKRNEIELDDKFKGTIDEFTEQGETLVACVGGRDKVILNPIIDWTDKQVWDFLNNVARVAHCELYDKGRERIGCILCPMATNKQKITDAFVYPYIKKRWVETIQKIKEAHGEGARTVWREAPETIFDWWTSRLAWEDFMRQKKDNEFTLFNYQTEK